jgi:hypothetical protein
MSDKAGAGSRIVLVRHGRDPCAVNLVTHDDASDWLVAGMNETSHLRSLR